jgi:glycosyltransferase involved in cell wall biosynthesis
MIITDFLPDEYLLRLHNTCQCFVMPSSGESWCRPAIHALAVGNPVITNMFTGTSEFVNNTNGWLVRGDEAPIQITDPPIPEVFNAHNTWYEVDVLDLQKAMRRAFELYQGDKPALSRRCLAIPDRRQ